MAKPTSGGAGGSGGRKRTKATPETYREFNLDTDGAAISERAQAGWDAQIAGLSWRDTWEMEDYQRNGLINYALRDPDIASRFDEKNIKSQIRVMDNAMLPLNENITLHRGGRVPDLASMFEKLGAEGMVGQMINDKAYMSTSYDIKVAEEFRNLRFAGGTSVMIKIRAPKGTKGIHMNPNQRELGYQREVVLARGTSLRIISIQKTVRNWEEFYEVEAEAVQ